MTTTQTPAESPPGRRDRLTRPGYGLALNPRRAWRLVERHARVASRYWWVQMALLAEPFVYLAAVGIGTGALVGDVTVNGRTIGYDAFIAPGLIVASAMTEAVSESAISFYVRLKYGRVYDAVLSTPLGVNDIAAGDLGWMLLRGSLGASAFLAASFALGLTSSPWALLAVPLAGLVALAFGSLGLVAATFMRSYNDFDIAVTTSLAMFLFSGVFFGLDQFPAPVAAVVEWTPLYRAVDASRSLFAGRPGSGLALTVAYLAAITAVGWWAARRRMERTLVA